MASPVTLIHIVSSNRWGGIERYALDICRHYKNSDWNVVAVTRDAKAVDTMFEKEDIKLFHARLGGMFDINSIKTLAKLITEAQGDVIIHVHGFRNAFTALGARKLSRKQKVRIVMTRHKVRRAVDSWLLRRLYRKIDAMIFVSRAARDRFLDTWHSRQFPFSTDRIHVIHNSLNMNLAERKNSEEKGPLTAMFHGPLKPGKGLEILIDALALLKGQRIRLRIVGGGAPDYVDKIRRRAISRGVMEMIDWHRHTDNPIELIESCHFGVLPSVSEEAFGLANIEYMAMGRPQICSSNGAQPEYITDGWEGFLIPPSNANMLAEAMKKLAHDSELRERMGIRAFQTFNERMKWSLFIDKLNRIYIDALNQ